ncbi:MAG: hypothetical protein HYZ15_03730 [Sphingobacteriales bacterium]|nr:hypothetical protein [Sphingobacteriales bacterium]
MRKTLAIFFSFALLFSAGGYYPLISVLQQQADRKLESLLDQDIYEEDNLVEVRVPLNMPYQQRYTEYERHYGNIEIDGSSYTYVKKKIDGDVVIFQCIPNQSRQQLKDMRYDLTRSTASAGPAENGASKQHPSTPVKSNLGDFDDQLIFPALQPVPVIAVTVTMDLSVYLPDSFGKVPHAPPKC